MKRLRMMTVVPGAMLMLVCALSAAQAPAPVDPAGVTAVETEMAVDVQLDANSKPQALPNDGRSEAVIQVLVTDNEQPVAGQTVKAQVDAGGGFLLTTQAITDAAGVATFQYRAGLMPEAGVINFAVENTPAAATALEIPLAPVAYLDVTLLTPQEYKLHKERQASAAPIYTLDLSGFPEQLAADGGSLCSLTAVLTTIDGKPAPGVPLKVEIASGDGQLQLDKKATDSSGKLQFYFTAGYTPGTVTVRVTETSTGLTTTQNLVLVKAGPARIELYYMDPLVPNLAREGALLPADGMTGMPMVAKVTDLLGLPLPGAEVKLEILDGNNGWLEVLDPISDAQGLVEFTYYSGGEPGKVRLRAYVAGGMKLESDFMARIRQ